MIDIAAILTTRNRPRFLSRAIRAIVAQRHAPAEIIVVDDASQNNVDHVIPPALPGIRIIRLRTRCGVSKARNVGASQAQSSVLAFLDDDDEWLPDYLLSVSRAFSERLTDVSCCGFIGVDAYEREYQDKDAPHTLVWSDFLLRNPGLRGSNLAIRATTFRRIGGFDESLATFNDLDIGIRLALASVSYVRIPTRLVRYHVHDGLRLSTPGTALKHDSCVNFLAKYHSIMSFEQRHAFRQKAKAMWRVTLDEE